MFKLTSQEQKIVAFLVGAILLGTLVRQWRTRPASKESPVPAAVETRD